MHFHLSGSHGCIFNDAILAHDILNSSCMHPWGHRSPLCTCLCQRDCHGPTVMMATKQKMCRGTSGSGHLADVAAFGMWGGRIMKACRTCADKERVVRTKFKKNIMEKTSSAFYINSRNSFRGTAHKLRRKSKLQTSALLSANLCELTGKIEKRKSKLFFSGHLLPASPAWRWRWSRSGSPR